VTGLLGALANDRSAGGHIYTSSALDFMIEDCPYRIQWHTSLYKYDAVDALSE